MNDLELLKKQVERHSKDETLLNAYADCLMEAGDHKRAEAVIELRNKQRLLTLTATDYGLRATQQRLIGELDRLWFVLGMRTIAAGDYLAYDDDGRVHWSLSGNYQRVVGIADTAAETGELVRVRLLRPQYPPGTSAAANEPTVECETSRL